METFQSTVTFLLVMRAATTSQKFNICCVALSRKKMYMWGDFQAALFKRNNHWLPPEMRSEPVRNERRNSILMTCHYPNMASATDWLKQISLAKRPRSESATSSVWNFCSRPSEVILQLFFWATTAKIWAGVALNSFLYLQFIWPYLVRLAVKGGGIVSSLSFVLRDLMDLVALSTVLGDASFLCIVKRYTYVTTCQFMCNNITLPFQLT